MPRVKRPVLYEGTADKKQKLSLAPFQDFLDSLDALQDDAATRQCVTAFVKLPLKKIYPDYYELIAEPISLNEILKKVARDAYTNANDLIADFRLMHDNAVKYNDPESWIVADAAKILKYVEEHAPEIDLSAESSEDSLDLPKVCLEVLDEVINHDFPAEGQLSGPFMDNIDPVEYPDYFTLIANPTSFNDVREKVDLGVVFSEQKSLTENLQSFHDATMLIFANAQQYNDPSSLIYEDAEKLRAVFLEKFTLLKTELVSSAQQGLKLTLKGHREPVKLKLSLKGKSPLDTTSSTIAPGVPAPVDGDAPPKKRRGRKPKKLIEEEQRLAALEAARLKKESGIVSEEEAEEEEEEAGNSDAELLAPLELCAMGKLTTIPSSDDVFIRRVAFTSSQTAATQIVDSLSLQHQQLLAKPQLLKKTLYPEAPVLNSATFFDYQFNPLGYSSKSYSITLPRDALPVVNFKVALHELIYNIKREDLIDGQGLLKGKAEEDFMCSLLLNDEEIDNGCEMTEEVDPADQKTKLLNLTYDLKLNYGLNVINFELRLSPSLSKSLKKKGTEEEPTELAGRHTRHQMQQIKLNWDVEKFTLFVVSHAS